MARPPKPIDWELVDRLLMAGCLGTEIAAHFDMHPDTFYNRVVDKYSMGFTEYQQEKRMKGESLLRAKQFEKAIKGDNSMLIWLGKNRLDQRDGEDKKQNPSNDKLLTDLLSSIKSEKDQIIENLTNELTELKQRLNAAE